MGNVLWPLFSIVALLTVMIILTVYAEWLYSHLARLVL